MHIHVIIIQLVIFFIVSSMLTGDNSHTAAMKLVTASQAFQTSQSKLLEKSEIAVTAALKNIYFMAQHSLPDSIFADLNKHCVDQGCADLTGLKVDKHTTYEHSESVHDFQESICEVITDDIRSSVGDKPYSIMLDESTDISVDQNLLVYIRHLDQRLGKFEPKSCLLSVRKLREGATAEKIANEVYASLDENDLDVERMCGVATDGAAVMVGRHSGVVTRLKERVPGLLASHCIAHRLALASGGAADTVPYLLKYQEFVNAIYKYFDNSPKNMARLDNIHKVLDESKKTTRFKQVFHTRWLSFEGSVKTVCDNYGELLSVLSEDKGAKAQGLLKGISTYKFLHVSFFLADVLKDLSILCKAFQSETVDFTLVNPLLESTVTKIEEHLEFGEGPMFSKFRQEVPKEVNEGVNGCEFEFRGHVVKDSEKQRADAQGACVKFGQNLLTNLKSRFAEKGDADVMSAMCGVFEPSVFAGEGLEAEWFESCVEKVADYMSEFENVERDEVKEQVNAFVSVVRKSYGHCCNNINDVCQVALKHGEVYPIVSQLAVKLLVVPVSSVDCERGFSRQNLIKTKLRNRLSTVALGHQMMIALEGPESTDFAFSKAFRKWAGKKQRRVCHVHK
jgi:hypothetical protein